MVYVCVLVCKGVFMLECYLLAHFGQDVQAYDKVELQGKAFMHYLTSPKTVIDT